MPQASSHGTGDQMGSRTILIKGKTKRSNDKKMKTIQDLWKETNKPKKEEKKK